MVLQMTNQVLAAAEHNQEISAAIFKYMQLKQLWKAIYLLHLLQMWYLVGTLIIQCNGKSYTKFYLETLDEALKKVFKLPFR